MSSMEERDQSGVGARLAARIRQLRAERGYSLDVLGARSGVSRSAISLIERGETSPTAVVLDKLATGLGVSLAALFDGPVDRCPPSPVSRRAAQTTWRDPQSGYLRRNVSPPAWPSPARIVEVEFPAGATVSYETAERDVEIHQQVWVLSGQIDVSVGGEVHQLRAGDCLAMRLDRPVTFGNPTEHAAHYAVVLVAPPAALTRVS